MSYDLLTNCYSREYLYSNFSQHKEGYLIYIDIDDFKNINDTYGHKVGDDYLKIFVNRVLEIIPNHSYLSRLGGDEFCLILPISSDIKPFLNQMLSCITVEIKCDNYIIYPSYSIGAVEFPIFSKNLEDNLVFADIAMYDIKKTGKNSYKIFGDFDHHMYLKKRGYKEPLIKALDSGSIVLNISPRYHNSSSGVKTLHSFLAKVIWYYNDEIISDKELFRIAEFLGLGVKLSNYLLSSMSSYIDTYKFSINNGIPIVLSINLTKATHFDILYKFYNSLPEKSISKNNVIFKTTYSSLMRLRKNNISLFKEFIENEIGVEIVDSKDLKLNALASNINIFSINYSNTDIEPVNFELIKGLLKHLDITMVTPKELMILDTVLEDSNTTIEANFANFQRSLKVE